MRSNEINNKQNERNKKTLEKLRQDKINSVKIQQDEHDKRDATT